MRLRTTLLSLTAAAAIATPAFADPPPAANGKATAPGQLCKGQSHKKTDRGKGKSPFAACVVGATRAQNEIEADETTLTAPGRLCKDQSRKKTNRGKGKSPFAACVTGAEKAQREQTA
jgi:hypothetical protein